MDHIGQKIKELRKKADMTQDRLADYLGVSAQAVSKWECGSASPDLSLIAPLCKVFGVTADELLGIAHEKDPRETEAEEELDRLMKTPGKDGKIDIRSLREKSAEAVKLYPDNLRIAYDYAVSLRFRAADPADGDEEAKRERKRTVEEILKRIIRESDDAELKKEAYGTLVLMLAQGGRKKEALALAEEGACKDRLRFMCLEGQEQIAFFQRCVHRDLYELAGFFAVGCAQIRDEAFKKGIRDAWEGILRAAIPDGNYGMFSMYFDACLEGKAAQLTKEGKYEEAVACLGEIMEMWEQVDDVIANRAADRGTLDPDWGHAYTAPLFEGVEISPVFDKSGNTSYADLFAKKLRMLSDFAPLEGREDYEALVGKYAPPRAEKPMTPDEFRDYLDRGLGRAILLLEKEKDKQIFCAVWQRMLLHPENKSPDKSGIVPYYARNHGLYDRDLALCFDPSGRLGEEIARKILDTRPPRWNALQLAFLLGREKEVNEILKEGSDASTSVLRQCLRGETDREWENVAQGWLEIAGVRAFCGTPKREIIRSALCDIADLFRLAPEREEDLKTLFWRYEDELRGKNWDLFWDILLEENPLASVMTVTESARSPIPAQEITVERCLAARQEDEDFDALVDGFQFASDEVFFAVLDAYLDEKAAGSARTKTLSLFFRDAAGRDTGGLLARVRRILDDPALRDTPVPLWLLECLKHTRDPRVRELGFELMNAESGQLQAFGRHMVYGANFMPEDADTVEEWLSNPPEVSYSAAYDVLDALRVGAEGVRESWFGTLYDDEWFRWQLVEVLQEKGCLPDDMREESLYDKSPYVRAAARGEVPEIRRHWRRKVFWKE